MSTQSVIYCNFCISLLWFLQVVLDAVIYIYIYINIEDLGLSRKRL